MLANTMHINSWHHLEINKTSVCSAAVRWIVLVQVNIYQESDGISLIFVCTEMRHV